MSKSIRALMLAALALIGVETIISPKPAHAQGAVIQSGVVVPTNLASWTRNGVLQDSGINSISLNFPTIANGHLIGNATGSSHQATDTALTALIDTLGTATQGSILYRDNNTNGWELLAPGTSGQLLTTLGAGANPAWTTVSVPNYTAGQGINIASSIISLISPVTVSLGGTGITSGTSGGIPYFSSSSQMATSALLAQHGVVIGGGSAAAPYTLASLGSSGQVLQSNGASADPSWVAAATGTVTSVATSGGLSGGTITTTGTVSCVDAASTVKGCPTPDGNSAHFLSGAGTWTTPPGTTPAPLTATSASFAPGAMGAGTCQTQVTAVASATTAMTAIASPAGGTSPGTGFTWDAFVSSAGNVTLSLCNISTGSLTPTSTTYNLRVIQ